LRPFRPVGAILAERPVPTIPAKRIELEPPTTGAVKPIEKSDPVAIAKANYVIET
jgi:hypothetical protein